MLFWCEMKLIFTRDRVKNVFSRVALPLMKKYFFLESLGEYIVPSYPKNNKYPLFPALAV